MQLKFGKVSLLFLALVIALAGVGGAFASWTQDVTFRGDVQMGNLEFEPFVKFSGTEVYKTAEHGVFQRSGWMDAWGPIVPGPDGYPFLVGSAYAMEAPAGVDADVLFQYTNIFPCVDWCADVLVHYIGSVPVMVGFVFDEGNLDPRIERTVSVYSSDANGTLGELIAVDDDWQMHYCDYVVIKVCLNVPQIEELQGQHYTFSGMIHAIQWNKWNNGVTYEIMGFPEVYEFGEETLWALCNEEETWCFPCPTGWGTYFQYNLQTDSPSQVDLVAGQIYDVGNLLLSDFTDGSGDRYLVVEYVMEAPDWMLYLTQLYVNPDEPTSCAPGGFEFKSEDDDDEELLRTPTYHKYVINLTALGLNGGDSVYLYIVAAHGDTGYLEAYAGAFDSEVTNGGKTLVLNPMCRGEEYSLLVDFYIANTGTNPVEIQAVDIVTTGFVLEAEVVWPPDVIDHVIGVGDTLQCSLLIKVGACTSGDPAGTVSVTVSAVAA